LDVPIHRYGYERSGVSGSLSLDCFRFHESVAFEDGAARLSNLSNDSLCVVYGPYMFLPVGRWRVELLVSSASEEAWIDCDVVARDAVRASCTDVISPESGPVALDFVVSSPHAPLEFRVRLARRTLAPVIFRGGMLARR
jgi:hypothetical protein